MKRLFLGALAALALFTAPGSFAQVTTDVTKTGEPSGYIGSYAYASLPAAPSYSGSRARLSDVGVAPGIVVVSDGTRWIPDGPQVLARGSLAASVTGTLTETTFATVTVPAGLMGVNGGLMVQTTWSLTNSANNKTTRVRLGGASGTQYLAVVATTTTTLSDLRRIRNRNSASSQVASSAATAISPSQSSGTVATGAVDTSVAQDVVFTGQLANTGETITLESYEVWVVP